MCSFAPVEPGLLVTVEADILVVNMMVFGGLLGFMVLGGFATQSK
jgi:hypothetical protein